jgi:predicted heme/steroid binding protein
MEALEMKDVKEFTGEKNKSAYVIVQDCVINVIDSKPWKGSLPMRRYDAGADLTQGIPAAGISR